MAECVLIAGLGFGDEGKGSITDYLTRRHGVRLIVRYNGGAQCAHNVVTDDGRHHTFSQFGSGTFTAGCRTHLSRYMLVQPGSMLAEARHLQSVGVADPLKLVTIEDSAPITTRFHMAVNRLREMHRAGGRHGSCGMGIGETVVDQIAYGGDTLLAGDMNQGNALREKLRFLQRANRAKVAHLIADIPNAAPEWENLDDPKFVEIEAQICEELAGAVQIVDFDWLDQELARPGCVLFEGAQGILLDQFRGFMPYCTRSTISFANALSLLGRRAGHEAPYRKLGIIRSYLTRHGAGPMPTEDEALQEGRREQHNCLNPWQQNFRLGHFDMVLFRYALEALDGVDEIALTHVDKTPMPLQVCDSYMTSTLLQPRNLQEQFRLAEYLTQVVPTYEPCYNLVDAIETESGKPVSLLSYGPKPSDKTTRGKIRSFA